MMALFDTEFEELENQLSRILSSMRPTRHGFRAADDSTGEDVRQAWSVMKEHGWLAGAGEDGETLSAARLRTYALFRSIGYHGVVGPFLGLGAFKQEFVAHLRRAGCDALSQLAADDDCALAWGGQSAAASSIMIRQGRLQGRLDHVVDGFAASSFLVVASKAEGGWCLVRIGRDDSGVLSQRFITVDGLPGIDLQCNGVDTTGKILDVPSALIERAQTAAWAAAAVAASAECAGLAQRLTEETANYVRLRKQFGQPIGAFQVVQHALVDAYIASEESLSLALSGASRLDDPDVNPAHMAARVLSGASERALSVAKTAVQLHGAIGFTDELPVGTFFRRVTYLSKLLVPQLELDAPALA